MDKIVVRNQESGEVSMIIEGDEVTISEELKEKQKKKRKVKEDNGK